MELNKVIENTKELPNKINKAFQKDLDNIINVLVENFDIYQRDSKVRIDRDILYKFITKDLKKESNCSAITKNGLMCTKKSHGNSNYCKIHYNKHFFQNKNIQNNNTVNVNDNDSIVIIEKEVCEENVQGDNLQKKFIEDSFYLVDDKYIYDKETYEKVGYINSNGEYILTDDPFILGVYN